MGLSAAHEGVWSVKGSKETRPERRRATRGRPGSPSARVSRCVKLRPTGLARNEDPLALLEPPPAAPAGGSGGAGPEAVGTAQARASGVARGLTTLPGLLQAIPGY